MPDTNTKIANASRWGVLVSCYIMAGGLVFSPSARYFIILLVIGWVVAFASYLTGCRVGLYGCNSNTYESELPASPVPSTSHFEKTYETISLGHHVRRKKPIPFTEKKGSDTDEQL